MSQPEISPLARRLAEENNVDWRGLHGSGAGGKVVERDVLEFLARVMAGEEDVDPTPEPVPEGMEAWPDEDVQSFQQEVQASRKDAGLDEIQQELSASDRLAGGGVDVGPDVGPAAETVEQGGMEPESDAISEDIFLFGDDAGEAEAVAGRVEAPAEANLPAPRDLPGEDEVEDELLVAGEDDADAGVPDVTDGLERGLADAGMDVGAPAAAGDEGILGAGQRAGAPGYEGAAYAPEENGELPEVFGDEEQDEDEARWADPDAALFADGGSEAPDDTLEVPSLGDVDASGAGSNEQDGSWGAEGTGAAEPREEAAWDVEAGPGASHRDEGASRPVFGEEPAAHPFEATGAAERAVGSSAEQAEGPLLDEAAVGDEPLPGESAAGAEMPPSPRDLPLVSYGALLRRHVDVTALAGAQLAVGLELGEGEPLSPAPFLVRAAAKAVAEESWGDGSVAFVALHDGGGVRSRRLAGAAGMPFLELVRAVTAGNGEDGPAALNVVDMSALDVDEAVLDVTGPQLTLGRILYDNQRGSYRSTLSLAGDVPAERGARLLARVAELLDAPVRLML